MMTFLVLALVLFTLGAHPFTSYPISLFLLRHLAPSRTGRQTGPAKPLSASLLICAHNEERWLPEKLRSIETILADGAEIEVLVYSDGSTDGTEALLAQAPPWVRVVASPERLGKAEGVNRLAEVATKELLVLSDANVILDRHLVPALSRAFADESVGVVCGTVIRVARSGFETAAVTEVYYRLEQWLKRLETSLGTTVMSDGSLYAVRRELFRPIPHDIMDDAFTSTSILCDGYRLVQTEDVRGWEADEAEPRLELARKRRIACQAFRCHLFLWPRLRRLPGLRLYMYLSHKFLRWLSGFLIAAGLVCGLAALATAPLAVAGLTAAMVAAVLAAITPRLTRRLAAIAGSFAFTSLGVLDALAGRTYVPWTPARSVVATGQSGS